MYMYMIEKIWIIEVDMYATDVENLKHLFVAHHACPYSSVKAIMIFMRELRDI